MPTRLLETLCFITSFRITAPSIIQAMDRKWYNRHTLNVTASGFNSSNRPETFTSTKLLCHEITEVFWVFPLLGIGEAQISHESEIHADLIQRFGWRGNENLRAGDG
jgi:hypothetical protein